MRESGLRLHLVAIIYLAAKLTITDQTITSLIKNAKIGTNCLWKHMGYWESSRNQAERVACFTSRTVTENNVFSSASLPPFKKRILCWYIYPSLPFNNILIKDRLKIKYIFKNFQCCFYHNPNFSQTLKKSHLKKKNHLKYKSVKKIPSVLLMVQSLCWVVIGGVTVLAASSVNAVTAVWRGGGKASLAGEPPSTYQQQIKSYSI